MTIISQPDITLNIVAAQTEVQNTEQRVLFIAQKTSEGTADSNELITDIQNNNSWDEMFGKRSMMAQGLRAARTLNGIVTFDVIALDDPSESGVAATATITFEGTATASGKMKLSVSSEKNNTYTVTVAKGETAVEIANKFVALLDMDDYVPVTAAHDNGCLLYTSPSPRD